MLVNKLTLGQFVASSLLLQLILFELLQCFASGYDLYEGSTCRLKDGSLGVCTKLPECPSIYNGLLRRSIDYSSVVRCSFVGVTEIICCGEKTPMTPKPTYTTPTDPDQIVFRPETDDGDDDIGNTASRGSGRKAEIACSTYNQIFKPALTFHILGGVRTSVGEFPHMAALGYPSTAAGQDVDWNCGGTLISSRFVLTAAHCINRNGPTMIRLGKVTIDSNYDQVDPVDMGVNEIIMHPEYKTSLQYHDIALIRLNDSVEYAENVRPACLNVNADDALPNQTVTVTGWGLIDLKTRAKSTVLLKANVTTVDLTACNQSHADYGYNRKLPEGLRGGQLCAYDPDLVKDACEGDSGGPLQIPGENGLSIILGITSFGISCASEIPGVYTRVLYYLDWIESVVWAE